MRLFTTPYHAFKYAQQTWRHMQAMGELGVHSQTLYPYSLEVKFYP